MSILRATEKVNSVNEEEELRKHGYVLGSTLGEGSYAKVKAAHSQKVGRKIALKIINKRKAPKDFLNKFLPRELEILRKLTHPNVVQLYEILYFNGKVSPSNIKAFSTIPYFLLYNFIVLHVHV